MTARSALVPEGTTATIVMPDGSEAPLGSDEAMRHISDVVARAHGVDPDTGELFDPKPYQAPVPTLDGYRADTLKLGFAGSVEIDKKIADDLEWFKGLRFGQEVELRVTATVGKSGWTLKRDKDDGEKVVHTLGLDVHTYEISE